MPRRTLASFFPYIIALALLIGWSVFLLQFSPSSIVEAIGVRNGYFAAFVVGFLGGVSTFISFPYYIFIATLGAGGLHHPILLGLLAGAGIAIGDTVSYFLGYSGRGIVSSRFALPFQRFTQWAEKRPGWLIPTIIFLYAAVVPFSNDVLVISMGFARYPYFRLMIPMVLGNIVFNTFIAYFGEYSATIF